MAAGAAGLDLRARQSEGQDVHAAVDEVSVGQFAQLLSQAQGHPVMLEGLLNQSQGGIYICGVMEDRLRHPGEALPPAHPRRTATAT